jgi:hypothetical protein
MKQAHEQDITLNELVENILRKFVDQEKTKAHLSDDEFWDKIAEESLMDDDHFDDQGVWNDSDEMKSDLEELHKEYDFGKKVQKKGKEKKKSKR